MWRPIAEVKTKKVFVQHIETLSNSEVKVDVLRSFVPDALNTMDSVTKSEEKRRTFRTENILNLSGCSKLDNLPEELYRVQTLVELHVDGTALYELPSSTMSLTNLRELSLGRCAGIPVSLWISNIWPLSFLRITQHPTALVVPSLSCLHMLKTVDVSHYNISGPCLNDIVRLPLLEDLNLSGTDIAVLPTNFGQLSHLKRLGLVGFKHCHNFHLALNILMTIQGENSVVSFDRDRVGSLLAQLGIAMSNRGNQQFTNEPACVLEKPQDGKRSQLIIKFMYCDVKPRKPTVYFPGFSESLDLANNGFAVIAAYK
ncbi:hypothetical protein POM88_014002 [Heracleum sosnowskyi]|uniref:Uncharacterized protein n=1 Tax=Heracleum sosnowskyi TaxID=360622 RepID=A0AAD8J270_9APIA|nr:hypothetical protein POM88_014002 [Heracleum sosnowskyi]